MKYSIVFRSLAGVAALVLFSCGSDDNPAGPAGGEPVDGELVMTTTYEIVDDNEITLYMPQEINPVTLCLGDALVTRYDTTAADTVRFHYELSGDTLKIPLGDDGLGALGDSGAQLGFELDSMAGFSLDVMTGVQVYVVFLREGSGSGLTGTWVMNGLGFEDTADALDPLEEFGLQVLLLSVNSALPADAFVLEFSGSSMNVYETWSDADWFIYEWNLTVPGFEEYIQSNSAIYDITVTKVSDTQVALAGNITGDTVMITWSRNGEIVTYTNSNPEREAHVWYAYPASCPNETLPSWWEDFLAGNLKEPLQKHAVLPGILAVEGLRGIFSAIDR